MPSALLAALALSTLISTGADHKEGRMEWQGGFCPVSRPSHRVTSNRKEWLELWKLLGQDAPAADLKGRVAVAVFLGTKPTGGFSVHFLEPRQKDGVLLIRYRVKAPTGFAIQALTQPYAVRLFSRPSGVQIKVEEASS
ncbi:MAG: protease complex subunit PrcB family protein [Elusimicrobia bacterium]|nr:protease complex subunit PrcB family protein [Elusimicrobiota bacterium]